MPPPPAAGGEEGRPVDPLGVVAGVVSGVVAGVVSGVVTGVVPLASGEALPVSLEATGGPGDGDPPGEGVEDEQAETAAEMSIAMVAQPMMVSIALSLTRATAGRTFMEPPHASRQVAALFSGLRDQEPAPEGSARDDRPLAEGRSPKTGGHKGEAHRRRTHNEVIIGNIRLREQNTPGK